MDLQQDLKLTKWANIIKLVTYNDLTIRENIGNLITYEKKSLLD